MQTDLTGILVCPQCRASLSDPSRWPEGRCVCPGCRRQFATRRGIPRFVESEAYAGSFGFEWMRHRQTQLDDRTSRESEETFRAKTGLGPDDVRGRLILDVGCGMGRFADVVSRWGGEVVAVDLSLAVEAAAANLAGRENVRCLQADCLRLPLAPGRFDLIYSIGVLHHTPDCAAAFRALVPLLRPGGVIVIWVYPHMERWAETAAAYRRLTTRLPHRLLHALCAAAIPLYYLHRLPLLGRLTRRWLPTSMHPRAAWRVLDTFDWYSPKYQSMHAPDEVRGWFEGAGLTDVRVLEVPVAVRGRRPATDERADG